MAFRRVERVSRMNGSLASTSPKGVSLSTASLVERSVLTTGPFPLTTSQSIPNAVSGVRMSEKKTHPSIPYSLTHWRLSSTAIAGVSDLCLNGIFSEYSLKEAMYRPACLMSHTGVRSTASPFASRSRMSWSVRGGRGSWGGRVKVGSVKMGREWQEAEVAQVEVIVAGV